jgi:membrane protein implicated in regulation of membrane protease activity
MQSRRRSALEAVANVLVGYVVAVLTQIAVFPLFGMHVPLSDNLLIGLIFTVVSLLRSYALRRVFNRWHSKGSEA